MDEILNICVNIATTLGKGYTENIYQEAICVCLREKGYIYSKEEVIPIHFKNTTIGFIRADILVKEPDNKIVIECKATDNDLKNSQIPKMISYIKSLKYDGGIIINFNQNPLKPLFEIMVVIVEDNKKYKVESVTDTYYYNELGQLLTDENC